MTGFEMIAWICIGYTVMDVSNKIIRIVARAA